MNKLKIDSAIFTRKRKYLISYNYLVGTYEQTKNRLIYFYPEQEGFNKSLMKRSI